MNNLQQTRVYSLSLRYLKGQTNIHFVASSHEAAFEIEDLARKTGMVLLLPNLIGLGFLISSHIEGKKKHQLFTPILFFSPNPRQIYFKITHTAAINKYY